MKKKFNKTEQKLKLPKKKYFSFTNLYMFKIYNAKAVMNDNMVEFH